ncbi:uncharacterized protein LOC129307848 [Prosopis cineraria]|uniref:uncharacterized protein LOC129307848 n=1 Tax=Prosopis cineraria TaxID=364024 RepID=UPI00240ED120|nr:uncharacterized protein LOC129307848 [Prosopis cineraria]
MIPKNLKGCLTCIWGFLAFNLADLPNNYFVVCFTDKDSRKEHCKKTLLESPWLFAGYCVAIQKWTPYFDPMNNPLRRMIVWVRIPKIPMHDYNQLFLMKLGEMIGKPIKVDMNTVSEIAQVDKENDRGRLARIWHQEGSLPMEECFIA